MNSKVWVNFVLVAVTAGCQSVVGIDTKERATFQSGAGGSGQGASGASGAGSTAKAGNGGGGAAAQAGSAGTGGTAGLGGASGASGVAGQAGAGAAGVAGQAGVSGTAGVAGHAGAAGVAGQAGVSGASGTAGVAGQGGSGKGGQAGAGLAGAGGAAAAGGGGGVAGGAGTGGACGSAVTLGPTEQFLTMSGDSSSLSLTGDLTIEAWVNLATSPPDKSFGVIATKWSGAGQEQGAYALRVERHDAFWGPGVFLRADLSVNGAAAAVMVAPIVLVAGQWAHVAFSYNAVAGTGRFLFNGSLLAEKLGGPPSIFDSTGKFRVGAFDVPDQEGGTWKGGIDEVRVWAVARSDAEIAGAMNATVAPQAGLVGYWPLDGSLLDASGNGNDLTGVGSPTFGPPAPVSGCGGVGGASGAGGGLGGAAGGAGAAGGGQGGTAGAAGSGGAAGGCGGRNAATMSLASTQYLSTAGDSAALSITGDLTIEGWLLSDSSMPDKTQRLLFGKYGDGDQRAYQVMLQHDETNVGSGVHLMLYVGPASNAGTVFLQYGVAFSPGTGTWSHVAIAYSASQMTASFYADGQLLGEKSGLPPALYDSAARFCVGAADVSQPSDLSGATWDGKISEVRVWNVARTIQEIQGTRLVTVSPQAGLQGYWPLNTDLLDATGNGNHLSATNGAALVAGGPPICDN